MSASCVILSGPCVVSNYHLCTTKCLCHSLNHTIYSALFSFADGWNDPNRWKMISGLDVITYSHSQLLGFFGFPVHASTAPLSKWRRGRQEPIILPGQGHLDNFFLLFGTTTSLLIKSSSDLWLYIPIIAAAATVSPRLFLIIAAAAAVSPRLSLIIAAAAAVSPRLVLILLEILLSIVRYHVYYRQFFHLHWHMD